MKLKETDRSAIVAWTRNPERPGLLAAGAVAGAIDVNFSSSAELELFEVLPNKSGNDLSLVGSIPTDYRFNSVTWGNTTPGSEEYPHGLVAGGMVDGGINIWNPAKILDPETSPQARIARLEKHQGAVQGLEFNAFLPNLLASGGNDSEIFIWDVTNINEPNCYTPGSEKKHANSEISAVAWNPKVQHILASTSNSGLSVVWDLKVKRAVISFSDPKTKHRCSALAWNPEVATQIIIASNDDESPVLQIWDLRNSLSPIKDLTGHTKGILSASWCPHDPDLFLTCGKDNRTLLWTPSTGEIMCELPASNNWNFDVRWSPCLQGILSTSSFDGKVHVYSLHDTTPYKTPVAPQAQPNSADPFANIQQPQQPVAAYDTMMKTALRHAPKWLKRPCGVSWGFGGKLLSFENAQVNVPDPATGTDKVSHKCTVTSKPVVTEPALVESATKFEAARKAGNLQEYCETKSTNAANDADREVWGLMRLLFAKDARRELLKHFGFDTEASNAAIAKFAESGSADTTGLGEVTAALGNSSISPSSDSEAEDMIARALVVGNFEGAVECCLRVNRLADALVLAASGGPDLWNKTSQKYFELQKTPFMSTVSAVVKHDLASIVSNADLNKWKEAFAILCTYAKSDEFSGLCDQLGQRLESEANDSRSATLCYMCAGNMTRAVDIWVAAARQASPATAHAELHEVVEKITVLRTANADNSPSEAVSALYCEYALLLASQGYLDGAMHFLRDAGSTSNSVSILMDQVFYARHNTQGETAPANPFGAAHHPGRVNAQPAARQQQPQASSQYRQQTQQPQAAQQQQPQQQQQQGGVSDLFQGSDNSAFPVGQGGYPQQNQQQQNYYGQQQQQQDFSRWAPPNQPQQQPVGHVAQYGAQRGTNPAGKPKREPVKAWQPPTPATAGQQSEVKTSAPAPETPKTAPARPPAQTPAFSTAPPPIAVGATPMQAIASVDTSSVPSNHRVIVETLSNTLQRCAPDNLPSSQRRKMDDVAKKMVILFTRLNKGQLSEAVVQGLLQITYAIQQGDYKAAQSAQVQLTGTSWDEIAQWMPGIRLLISAVQSAR
eukprot:TRINITY_DN9004_c0_g1_i2.p1 TRINITY_DN9004_c0_g1~~TRINITY_DN9004_c0_g1_i2.p1  ORF type:complete len:1069 (-),score=197.63 TRINITY_DN9004_c0_g1_i2:94-3300(-)